VLIPDTTFTTFDGDQIPYRVFASSTEPQTVIIGTHGISGASYDYTSLGNHLTKHNPETALYAYETRGQGLDPNPSRRGDIYLPEEWFNDLYAFTRFVRKKHPTARILWCGESMGALITLNAYAKKPKNEPLADALILIAPVVKIGNQVPAWKIRAAKLLAWLAPKFRITLGDLSGPQNVKVTQGADDHNDQSEINPWHIPKYSLRLLANLGKLIESMPQAAKTIQHPTLILNGGQDYFTPPEFIETFLKNIPKSTPLTHKFYPTAYHLLMYDDLRDTIYQDISQWLKNQT